MCLATVTRKAAESTGFKFLQKGEDGTINGIFYGNENPETGYELKRWYASRIFSREDIRADHDRQSYAAGFHILPTPRAALNYHIADRTFHYDHYVLARVTYRGVLAQGIDNTSDKVRDKKVRCVVAAQMRVEEVIEQDNIESYLRAMLPTPKRRTITVDEFVTLYNESYSLVNLAEKVEALLGYDIQAEAQRRLYKVAKRK